MKASPSPHESLPRGGVGEGGKTGGNMSPLSVMVAELQPQSMENSEAVAASKVPSRSKSPELHTKSNPIKKKRYVNGNADTKKRNGTTERSCTILYYNTKVNNIASNSTVSTVLTDPCRRFGGVDFVRVV